MAPKAPAPKGGTPPTPVAKKTADAPGDAGYAAWQQRKAQERKCGNCGTSCTGCLTCPHCGQWVGGD